MGQVARTGYLNQHFYYDHTVQLRLGTDSQLFQSERTELQLQFDTWFDSLGQYIGSGIPNVYRLLSNGMKFDKNGNFIDCLV